jgi:hypothetical protein
MPDPAPPYRLHARRLQRLPAEPRDHAAGGGLRQSVQVGERHRVLGARDEETARQRVELTLAHDALRQCLLAVDGQSR